MLATLAGLLILSRGSMAGNFYSGTSPSSVPWPGGIVPYEFTNTLTSAQQRTYLDGLREWELAANVKFVPHTSETRWILFDFNTNSVDTVFGDYSPQVVTISSLSRGQVCHEMGHSFGFTHENIRVDQATYLTVLTNNIVNETSNIVWFTIDRTSAAYGTYDFESVMHLGWDFDSIKFGVLPTQQPKAAYFQRYQFRMGNACISPGDRAALAYLYGSPTVPLTNVVTTTADSGAGSLRAALYYVTDNPGAVVRFNIPTSDPGYSNGVFNLKLTGQLPPLVTSGIVLDGSTQPGFNGTPLIVVDGSAILPETYHPDSGLIVYSANNVLKGLSFQGFSWNGLTLSFADATNNLIGGCWVGLDGTGRAAMPNVGQGIFLNAGASRNTIGSTNSLLRNVISGNRGYGIIISDTNTTGNIVVGNYIGTDAQGSFAVANGLGGIGIFSGANGQVVGGDNPQARNVISGNTNAGIWLAGEGVRNNTVRGNFIGLNSLGTAAVPNSYVGMYVVQSAQNNSVFDNVISGNLSEGVRISDAGTFGNVLQGNLVGTDATGSKAVPNGWGGATIFNGATSNLVGGATASERNVISANGTYGIAIADAGTRRNQVLGNLIGTDVTGTNGLGNGYGNVGLYNGASQNSIGDIGGANVIAFGRNYGVQVRGTNTVGNSIRGNSIFGNAGPGVYLEGYGVGHSGGALPGPNDLQNYPVITNALASGGTTTISGSINSTPNRAYWIDFYANPSTDSGRLSQGKVYLGTMTVTTLNDGNAPFSYLASGNLTTQFISATATDQVTGDTSECTSEVVVTPGVPLSCTAAPAGLVGWWKGDGSALDSTGTNTGSLIGAVGFAAGEVDQAFVLNGTDAFISIPSLNFRSAPGITIECWIKPASITLNQYYEIVRQDNDGITPDWLFAFQGYGTVLAFGLNAGGIYDELHIPILFSDYVDAKWHHVAATYDGSTKRVYKDGVEIGSEAKTGSISYAGQFLAIGALQARPFTAEWFDGMIDEVSIYNRGLTVAEVLAVYEAGSYGKCGHEYAGLQYTNTGTQLTITNYTGTNGVVAIPATIGGFPVTGIGASAFESAHGVLTSVTIPEGIANIGDWAFGFCSGLTAVSIPSSVTNIGAYAFDGCSSLVAIEVNSANSAYTSLGGALFSRDQTSLLEYPGGVSGGYVIPVNVTTVGEGAFSDCPRLTSVVIPNGVTNIGSASFANCSSLTNLFLPDSVTDIEAGAFQGCSGLSVMILPKRLDSIDNAIFSGCTSLTAIHLPEGVKNLGYYAFSNCRNLASVFIPSSVTNIGAGAFDGCANLTTITIPGSVTSIQDNAFLACTALTNMFFLRDAPNVNSTALSGDGELTVYYLPGTKGWSNMIGGVGGVGGRPAVMWNPMAQLPQVRSNGLNFDITGTTNIPLGGRPIPVAVEGSTGLVSSGWVLLQLGLLTNGFLHFSDPLWTNYPNRFYRIRNP